MPSFPDAGHHGRRVWSPHLRGSGTIFGRKVVFVNIATSSARRFTVVPATSPPKLFQNVIFMSCHKDFVRILISRLKMLTFFTNDVICHEGMVDGTMYFIHKGTVGVYKLTDTEEVLVDELQELDSFGIVHVRNWERFGVTLCVFLAARYHSANATQLHVQSCHGDKRGDFDARRLVGLVAVLPGIQVRHIPNDFCTLGPRNENKCETNVISKSTMFFYFGLHLKCVFYYCNVLY